MSVVERALKKLQGKGGGPQSGRPVLRSRSEAIGSVGEAARVDESPGALPDRIVNIDPDALARAGLLAPGNDRLSDQYRAIKQPVLRKAVSVETDGDKSSKPDKNRLILVSSAFSGEGKTFTCVNFGFSLAQERDWSVLLVDTDCRNPSLSRLLGVTEEPGLLDYLADSSVSLESCILRTSIDRLLILPVGRPRPDAAELLASERMKAACNSINDGKFGAILAVFDSSPVLQTPEPLIVSQSAGQLLFVVRAGRTPRAAVAEALGQLDYSKSIGLVLNQVSASGNWSPYNYGSAYGESSQPLLEEKAS